MSQRNVQLKAKVIGDILVSDHGPRTLKPGEAVSVNRAAQSFLERRGLTMPWRNRNRRTKGPAVSK